MISPQLVNNTMQTKAHIHNSNELLSCELLNITTRKSYIRNFCKCIICKNIMYRTKAHKKHYCNFDNEEFKIKNEFTLASDRVNCTENNTTVTNNTTKQSDITSCAKLYEKHFQEPRNKYSKKLSNHQYKATDKDAYNIDNISTQTFKDDFNSKANELETKFYDDVNISEYKNELKTIYNKFK